MKIEKLKTRKQRKFNLIVSVTTIFAAAFIMGQLMFAPSMVQTVYAGSTLTPTSVPADTATPVPPPTETPVPPPTNTPQPSNSGGSSSSSPAPTPTPTPVPVVPQEIPELGIGSTWQPLILTLMVLLVALAIAVVQVRYLLQDPSDQR